MRNCVRAQRRNTGKGLRGTDQQQRCLASRNAMRWATLEQRHDAGEERLANGCDEKWRPRKVALSLAQVSASSTLREKSYCAYANLK
jgi:hypothetical protein